METSASTEGPVQIIEPQAIPRPRTACKKKDPLGRPRATLLPFVALACILCLPPRGTRRAAVQHPTRVSFRNSRTASVALSSHSFRAAGALRCSHPHSLPTLLHSLCLCAVHARRPTKRRCLDSRAPLSHHRHLLDSRWRGPVIFS